ncbi:unnamed protein product [Rotaria sp. Silwood1]|nr:unnamed protein product [Rotaria sp. Silwood1]
MHLEIFCLVWLDSGLSSKDGRETEQKLRSIINHLKKFQDVEQCRNYVNERSSKERVVMVVSGQLGRKIVPTIHSLRQVISIYVYCFDKKRNEEWACKYAKAVVTELHELISLIKVDHKIQKTIEEPLSINIFTTGGDPGKSTISLNGEFAFSQVLIDCLIRLPYTEDDRRELISLCKEQYKGNSVELSNIRAFRENYSSEKALWWYSKEMFFYKTLNAALRKRDIHTIFLFRKYITDIQNQLRNYQAKNFIRVYRSQMISSNELDILKQCRGQFISVNSFFSTSMDKQQALSFLRAPDATSNLERVLFVIDADPKLAVAKPFAAISEYCEYRDESEVLFMLGSIFRLDSIERNSHSQVWIVQMALCDNDEHHLKQVLMDIREQFVHKETNLQTLGKLLWEMGRPDLAERYFIRMLEQLPPDNSTCIDLYQNLGTLASNAGQLDKSMKWRQKAIELRKQVQFSSSSISKPKNAIGNVLGGYGDRVRYGYGCEVVPLRGSSIDIHPNAQWQQNGLTVAGGNGLDNQTHQLSNPYGLHVDEQAVYVADRLNHRIVEWKLDATSVQVVAGENGQGRGAHQLSNPLDVIVDKETDSLIISDSSNRRVVRWPRRDGAHGETIISKIDCVGLTMDENGYLYVTDIENDEVRRYRIGESKGTLVAGGNGSGNRLDQLSCPQYVFVDREHSLYISDWENHRVMKWVEGEKQGTVVAGAQGKGNDLTQLSSPAGIVVDQIGTVYVADRGNDRIMRWSNGATQGTVVVGGNGRGKGSSQLNGPIGLSFDRDGNLYVVDLGNDRVQKFSIDSNT